MGLVLTYYVLEDQLIERKKQDPSFDLEQYIEDELLPYAPDDEPPFLSADIEFGTGVKAWNPMFEALKLMESSKDTIINHVFDVEQFDDEFLLLNSAQVRDVWGFLKAISVEQFEQFIKREDTIERIKNVPGYRMDGIVYSNSILLEFRELLFAFRKAEKEGKAIGMNIG